MGSRSGSANILFDLPEFEVGVAVDVSFTISGSHHAATRRDPEEFPEVEEIEVEDVEIDDDYRDDDSVDLDMAALTSAVEALIESDYDNALEKIYDASSDAMGY